MGKVVAILQSNYIPWKGYFELIDRVDEFILYDEMQYTRRDWRNRNKIKTSLGCKWLTLPVEVKGKYLQKISETRVAQSDWAENHWRKIIQAYCKGPYFSQMAPMIHEWYKEASNFTHLSIINRYFITQICQFLDITSKISSCSDYSMIEGKSERLLQLCLDVGGSCYLSGPAALDYLDVPVFLGKNVEVQWMNYVGYPAYPQLHGDFEHGVSILDVIFNCGPRSRDYVIRGGDSA